MATAPTPTATPSAEEFAALQLRVTALDEFLAQLAPVLACEPRGFTAERMNHWLNICTAKMITTGSAKPEEVAALRRLQGIVVG